MYKLPLLAVVLTALVAVSPAAAHQRATSFALPAEFAGPNGVVSGPDGATWVTDSSLGRIWRVGKHNKVRSYELGQQPGAIVSAYGSMWVADAGGDAIHRVETDGSSVRYPLASGSFPTSIVKGPDGALWFTATRANAIGRLALDGTVTEYPIPTSDAFAGDIMVGPDGALWFSEQLGNKVGRVTTAGEVTEYPVPGADPLPGAIVAGPDGALYVAERNDNVISRLTTAGEFTTEYALPRENANPVDMVAGPDGALYISEHSTGLVSRMTFKGRFTDRYRIPRGFNDSLAFGRDDTLWITQGSLGRIARLEL